MKTARLAYPPAIGCALLLLALASCQPRTSVSVDDRPRIRGGDVAAPTDPIELATTTPFGQIYAGHPIAWRPFGPVAFAAARESGRPLMVHSGFTTCAFTRNLANGPLSDPEFARFCNDNFVCTLLDSEQYTVATALHLEMVQRLGGIPAWPMVLWLDHDGIAFFVHSFAGNDSFSSKALLASASAAASRWTNDPEVVRAVREQVLDHFQTGPGGSAKGSLPFNYAELLDEAYHSVMPLHDAIHGTMSPAQNFVQPITLGYLFDLKPVFREGDFRRDRIGKAVRQCLDAPARGAIRDPLDGGFFRYSEKPGWDAPRSEKTLADQAMIASLYFRAAREFDDPRYLEIANAALDFARNNQRRDDGLYLSSITAFEEPPAQKTPFLSRYFRWSVREIEDLLTPEQFQLIRLVHGLDRRPDPMIPNTGGRGYVLGTGEKPEKAASTLGIPAGQAAESIAAAYAILREERAKRPGLFRDERAQLSGNALMVSALVDQATASGQPPTEAEALFAKIRTTFAPDGEISHQIEWRERATALDQATDILLAIKAALDLHAAGGRDHLDLAGRWYSQFEERFVDPIIGTVVTGRGTSMMPGEIRRLALEDTALPSDSALHARVLRKFAEATGESIWLEKRDRVFEAAKSAGTTMLNSFSLLAELAIREVSGRLPGTSPARDPDRPVD